MGRLPDISSADRPHPRRGPGRYRLSLARSPAGPLVLRTVVASLFLWEAFNQVRKGWIGGDGLQRMITSALNGHSVPPLFRSFLENAVLEHDQTFTLLAIAGEIAIGAALLL